MQKTPPEQQNNVWMAMMLSMAVFLAWNYFYFEPSMRETKARQAAEKQAQAEHAKAEGLPAGTAIPSASPTSDSAPARTTVLRATSRDAALALSPRLPIETPSLKGSIGLKGGRIDDLLLVKYREMVDPKSPNIVLFSPTEAPHAYFADYGWSTEGGASIALPGRETLWTNTGAATLTPSTPVVLTWDNGQGLNFKRTISVDPDFMFKVNDEVENKGTAPVTLRPYARIFRDSQPNAQANYVLHEGLVGYIGDAGLKEFKYDAFAKTDENRTGVHESFKDETGGWLGITDKYWAAALIPDQKSLYSATFSAQQKRTAKEDDQFETRVELPVQTIAPGAMGEADSQLYAGAKLVTLIETYEKSLGIKNFNMMIDWGWFWFVTKPLFHLMENINHLVGNFGVTIILITVLVKAIFFPLANSSYESMAKMKKLQPEMEKIKERFKDDKDRQSKEVMALYQREKVNPLAGCLPVLLQIPVFFGLYKVLYGTIDMRHAPFFGWIKDLSAADPTSIFNLFGALPFDVPQALMIGVWPLIMGITMWMQMQMNPPPPDPVQAQVFQWMPVMFTFMMASFPAGLVIYWAVNNILTMAQQTVINRRLGVDVHIKDNMIRQWNDIKSVFTGGMPAKPGAPSKKDDKDDKAKKDEKAKS